METTKNYTEDQFTGELNLSHAAADIEWATLALKNATMDIDLAQGRFDAEADDEIGALLTLMRSIKADVQRLDEGLGKLRLRVQL